MWRLGGSLVTAVALVFLLGFPVAEAQQPSPAGAPVGPRIRDHGLLKQPTIPVALVAVSRIDQSAEGATADLRVEEVLRGSFPPGTFRADIVYPDRLGRLLAEWKPGDVWLAFFSPSSTTPTFVLDAHARSTDLLSYVRANLAPPDRSAAVQAPVFVLILTLPFVLKALGDRRPRAVLAGTLCQLGLYGFYESGISVYTNIRIDLLLVYPAIIWSVVIARRAMSSRRTGKPAPA